jgi:uncharacterized protein YidB (DUF937 family)
MAVRLVHEVLREIDGGDDRDLLPLGAAMEDLLGGPRGTLADLADRFTQARLGAIMASWIHDGPNEPIRPDELARVLGAERVRDLATVTGLPEDAFLRQMATHLPRVIDRMTPEGYVTEPEDPDTLRN